MHYTSNGQELTDVTRMGLYFRKDPPKYNFRSLVFAQPKLRIPPNTKEHAEDGRADVRRADCGHLQPASARALPRQGGELRRALPGWPRGDAAQRAGLRLQLAVDLRPGRAADRAGRHAHRVHAGVRQLEPEQGEPRSEPRGDLGRADLGRNGVRRDPLSQRDGRRAAQPQTGPSQEELFTERQTGR